MKAKNFVNELNALIDSNDNDGAQPILNMMRIKPVKRQTSFNDELGALINNYEMEGVEIGMFGFFSGYKVIEKHLLFGKIEMDLLGVDRSTKEIVLLDHDQTDHVMLKCASNSASFLDFLDIYAKFIINRLFKRDDYKLPELTRIYEICGGEDYKQFVDFCFSGVFD